MDFYSFDDAVLAVLQPIECYFVLRPFQAKVAQMQKGS